MIKRIRIATHEKGLLFKEKDFQGLLHPGTHWITHPFTRSRVEVASMRSPFLVHPDLDIIVKSGQLEGLADIHDLKDNQRALVWVDGRFETILGPGLHAIWKTLRKIHCEVVETTPVRFQHREHLAIAASPRADEKLTVETISEGFAGVAFAGGTFTDLLDPGTYLFWKGAEPVTIHQVDLRRKTLDISGQEIMTKDKVTLRLNVVLTCMVNAPKLSVTASGDSEQALYRETQLAVRSVIGSFDLDSLLADKEAVADKLRAALKAKAEELGHTVISLGIRDIILPGEMKELMNRVIEARKSADANLITRREETAAMRSQANTARLLENNPTLMRLRELDVLEKIAANSDMKVILGEKGLTDRVVNLL